MSRVIIKGAGKRDPLNFMWKKNPASESELGGGFQYFFFHPYLGKISNLTSIFFKWVGSTTNQRISTRNTVRILDQVGDPRDPISSPKLRMVNHGDLNDLSAFRVSVIWVHPNHQLRI